MHAIYNDVASMNYVNQHGGGGGGGGNVGVIALKIASLLVHFLGLSVRPKPR